MSQVIPEKLAILQKVPKFKTPSQGLLYYNASSAFASLGTNLGAGKYVIQSDGANGLTMTSELSSITASFMKTSGGTDIATNALMYWDSSSTVKGISIPSFNDNQYYCFMNGAFSKPTYFNNIITSSLVNTIATTTNKGILGTSGVLQCATSGEQYAITKDSQGGYALEKIVQGTSGLTGVGYKSWDIEFADHTPASWTRQPFTTKFGGCSTVAAKTYIVTMTASFSFTDVEGMFTAGDQYFTLLDGNGSTLFKWKFTPQTTNTFSWTGAYTFSTTSVDWRCDLQIPAGTGIDIDYYKITMVQATY